jgi:hypothetical protein
MGSKNYWNTYNKKLIREEINDQKKKEHRKPRINIDSNIEDDDPIDNVHSTEDFRDEEIREVKEAQPYTNREQDEEDDFDDSYNGYGGMGGGAFYQHSDLLKELTNFDPYLKETVNGWLGVTWNEEEGKFKKDINLKPVMNIYCAGWCISFLKTYTRKNNIITDIGKKEYIFVISDVIDVVWLNLGTRMEEFEIKGLGDVIRICNELEHAACLVLMGAGDGKYNRLLGDTTRRNESLSMSPMQQGGMSNQFGNNYVSQRGKMGMMQRFKNLITG